MLRILQGDALEQLRTLPAQSVQCCVTSPPYWGLRDYGTAQWEGGEAGCEHKQTDEEIHRRYIANSTLQGGLKTQRECAKAIYVCKCGARRIDSQLGLEATPEEYIEKMVGVFLEVRRVLRDDGTLWLNLGDSYATNGYSAHPKNEHAVNGGLGAWNSETRGQGAMRTIGNGLKPKDLCMMPARLAMALQADGWYLRSDIIWHKPNPMPESVTDRPTKAHEYIFLLTKQERYFYDAEAIREAGSRENNGGTFGSQKGKNWIIPEGDPNFRNGHDQWGRTISNSEFRNKRTVWTIATQPYAEAHFATFPEEIPKLCTLAGSKPGDTILDPFAGSGTVGKVALELGRKAILIELNPKYVQMIENRTSVTIGMF